MSKWWSLLFAVMTLACVVLFLVSPWIPAWWLPKQASSHASEIDNLFYVILGITGFFFILTEVLLFVFIFRYAAEPGQKRVPAPAAQGHTPPPGGLFGKVKEIIKDEHRLEMLWTIVPAVILLYIAFAQIGVWAEVKYQARMPQFKTDEKGKPKTPIQMEVTARQWEWRIRYPSPKTLKSWENNPSDAALWARKPQYDDIYLVNEVHTYYKNPTLVQLRTADVIHSFFLPQMRIKQDALPGKTIPVWFTPIMYNCKPQFVYSDSNTQPPEGKQQWHLYDQKKTDKGKYTWVSWQDGYDEKNGFGDTSQIWELNCAELCGAFHYRMIGRLYVHENEPDFRRWLEVTYEEKNSHGNPKASAKPAP